MTSERSAGDVGELAGGEIGLLDLLDAVEQKWVEELGGMSGVIQALAVPDPTATTPTSDSESEQ